MSTDEWAKRVQPRRARPDLILMMRVIERDADLLGALQQALVVIGNAVEDTPGRWNHLDCVVRLESGEVTLYPAQDCERCRTEDICVGLNLLETEKRLVRVFDENEAVFEAESERSIAAVETALREAPLASDCLDAQSAGAWVLRDQA